MSADNGIYILQTPGNKPDTFEYRVAEAMAIENVYEGDDYLVSYFGASDVYNKEGALAKAARIADQISDDGNFTEYGICSIHINTPFPKMSFEEAQKLLYSRFDNQNQTLK